MVWLLLYNKVGRKKSGENGMRKSKNKVYRRIAVALTVALLAGQCHISVLAKEETDIPGETVSDNSSAGDDGEGESGAGDNGTGDEDVDQGGEEGDPNQCICETACTEDGVNMDCPVCAADFANCAKKAGGEGKPPEEGNDSGNDAGDKETISENNPGEEETVSESAGIVLLENDDTEILEEETDSFTYSYTGKKIWYHIIGENTVEVGINKVDEVLGPIEIPTTVKNSEGKIYQVVRVGEGAFDHCNRMTQIILPESIVSIGKNAFRECLHLQQLTIPKSVTRIEEGAFYGCGCIIYVKILGNVESIGKEAFYQCGAIFRIDVMGSIGKIEEKAFWNCTNLEEINIAEGETDIGPEAFSKCWLLASVKIPKAISIGSKAFSECSNIKDVTISEKLTNIGDEAFLGCTALNELCIVVSSDGKFKFPQVGANAFKSLPAPEDRKNVIFLDGEGKELTGDTLYNAKVAFAKAAKGDGDSDNSRWYGWFYEGLPEVEDTYKVDINVQVDGHAWTEHGKIYKLKKAGSDDFVEDLEDVEGGTYEIYDVTGVDAVDEYGAKGVNTGVTVTVEGTDVSVTVDYYTATFYDGTQAYPAGTPQAPQIVLKGQKVNKPTDPSKADYAFARWKTKDGDDYDFDAAVTDPTGIYASWVEKTAEQVHITASSTEGGTISPTGDIAVTKGAEQTFTITPNE